MEGEVISVFLPQKLGKKLRKRAEEMGYLPDELAVELLRERLNEELDPEDLVEHYRTLSEKYLAEAKEFLSKEDLVQTSEKLWGAAALAVKMVAAKRGLKLEAHRSLWDFVSRLSRESGDEEIITFFHVANSLHRNFYENQMDKASLEVAIRNIEQLIEKLKRYDDAN